MIRQWLGRQPVVPIGIFAIGLGIALIGIWMTCTDVGRELLLGSPSPVVCEFDSRAGASFYRCEDREAGIVCWGAVKGGEPICAPMSDE